MRTDTLNKLIWVFIYGGLLGVMLGLFVRPDDDVLGWVLVALGTVAAIVGATMIWVRSRRPV